MDLCGITDRGKVRSQNQDAFFIAGEDGSRPCLLLVCDGMGGAKAGNVASELASAVFKSEAGKLLDGDTSFCEYGERLRKIASVANTAVYELSRADVGCSGMGTTLVAAAVSDSDAAVINIGDSRAYLITQDELRQITKDHSLVEDMVDRGEITREESRTHPNKNFITRALGTMATVESDIFEITMEEGSYLLLCSDGLTNIVEDWEIQYEVTHGDTVQASCDKLLQLALSRGAPDNVTIVLYKR